MTEFDETLRSRMSAEDEAFLRDLEDDRGLFRQLGDTFRGPMRNWVWATNLVAVVASGIGLYAIWQMIAADTTRGLILWAAAGWAAWTIQIAAKQWIWQRMNLNSVLRALKMIELRLARLEER